MLLGRDAIAHETLADELLLEFPPSGVHAAAVDLESGSVTIGLRVTAAGGASAAGGAQAATARAGVGDDDR